jgi:hypothetical protein
MSDQPKGVAANAGEAIQQKVNQASSTHDAVAAFIQDNPMTAALMALGVGYILAKVI